MQGCTVQAIEKRTGEKKERDERDKTSRRGLPRALRSSSKFSLLFIFQVPAKLGISAGADSKGCACKEPAPLSVLPIPSLSHSPPFLCFALSSPLTTSASLNLPLSPFCISLSGAASTSSVPRDKASVSILHIHTFFLLSAFCSLYLSCRLTL